MTIGIRQYNDLLDWVDNNLSYNELRRLQDDVFMIIAEREAKENDRQYLDH